MSAARSLTRAQRLALAFYGASLIGALLLAWLELADLGAGRDRVRQAGEVLARLARAEAGVSSSTSAAGSSVGKDPFLGGETLTVAGANLQERVVAAIRRAGGTVTSSQ